MSITIRRRFLPARRPAGITVDLVGDGTAWTQGGTTFTPSGVAGCSVLTKIVHSNTSARLVVATGTAVGTLTIGDGTATGTVAVVLVGPARGRWFAGLAR